MRRHGSSGVSRTARACGVALLGLSPVTLLACAQILSYDDYQARPANGADATVADAETSVGDAAADGPARAPSRPAGEPKVSGGKTIWTAVKRYYLGHLDPEGKPTDGAWGHWGYDIDGVCTSENDSIANIGTCLRHPEAQRQDFLMDGLRCRDNNFGQHIVTLLDITSTGFEENLNDGVLRGSSTWVLRLDDVGDADDPFVPGRLYRAEDEKNTALAPKWDGKDVRRAISSSVLNKNLETPVAVFSKGYIVGNTWVSGEPEPQTLVLSANAKTSLALQLQSTVFTLELDGAHSTVNSGVLAGVMPISTIESVVGPAASSGGICPGEGLYESILSKVRTFPDVTVGAAGLQDVTKECDGISLGIGFTFAPVQPITTLVDPPPPEVGKCDDAGVDAGGGG